MCLVSSSSLLNVVHSVDLPNMNGNRQRRFSFAVWAFDGKHKITILASGMIQAKHLCLVKYETIGGF